MQQQVNSVGILERFNIQVKRKFFVVGDSRKVSIFFFERETLFLLANKNLNSFTIKLQFINPTHYHTLHILSDCVSYLREILSIM